MQLIMCIDCWNVFEKTGSRGKDPLRCENCLRLHLNDLARESRIRNPRESTAVDRVFCECGAEIPTEYREHGGGSQRKRCDACELRKKRIKWRRALCRKHGITLERYEEILTAQNGVCAVRGCGMSDDGRGRSLHIDHDHKHCPGDFGCALCVRSLLCARHNIGIGYFNDDPDDMEATAELVRANRRVFVVA